MNRIWDWINNTRHPLISPKLISKLRDAKRVVVLTGAGISAESGVPTFRDAQTGIWAEYNPEELATPHTFEKNPWRVWEWYTWRRELIDDKDPNDGHYAITEMQRRLLDQNAQFTLITQNVDGLHKKAGSKDVLELHGNIFRSRCSNLDCDEVVEYKDLIHTETPPPRCTKCNGLLRPDVVWYGEALPLDDLHKAMAASQRCDLFFTIGTSTLVQPAASLPTMALDANAEVVEINPVETPITKRVTYPIEEKAGFVLPMLVKAAWPELT